MRFRICKYCGEMHALNAWPDNHRDAPPARSPLPAAMVISDTIGEGVQGLWHPSNNRIYDSKRDFRKTTRQYGGEEVGTEVQQDRRVMTEVAESDVATAYKMVEQGYRPNIGVAETGVD